MLRKISCYTSTAPVALYTTALAFMTPCNTSSLMWQPSARAWLLVWGAVLLCGGAAGKRSALPHARVMIHQPSGGAQGQSSDIEITAKQIIILRQELYEIISRHSNQPFEKVEKDSDRDYWMKAEEAKQYGLIDEVLVRV